jgi:hypothetical protein
MQIATKNSNKISKEEVENLEEGIYSVIQKDRLNFVSLEN